MTPARTDVGRRSHVDGRAHIKHNGASRGRKSTGSLASLKAADSSICVVQSSSRNRPSLDAGVGSHRVQKDTVAEDLFVNSLHPGPTTSVAKLMALCRRRAPSELTTRRVSSEDPKAFSEIFRETPKHHVQSSLRVFPTQDVFLQRVSEALQSVSEAPQRI